MRDENDNELWKLFFPIIFLYSVENKSIKNYNRSLTHIAVNVTFLTNKN